MAEDKCPYCGSPVVTSPDGSIRCTKCPWRVIADE